MPRFRLRLATLGLLIAIIAMAVALVIQQRRERALTVRMQALEAENRALVVEKARDRSLFDRMRLVQLEVTRQRQINQFRADIDRLSGELERLEVTRQRQVNKLRAQVARLSGEGKDAGRDRPTDHGEAVTPKY